MLCAPEIGDAAADVIFLDAGGVEQIKYPYFLLNELKMPFTLVVDKDFFFEYLNGELALSRNDHSGLPIYKQTMKENAVLQDIFRTDAEIHNVEEANGKGYRKFFECIKRYHILSMNYCLEMDLTCSTKARDVYYNMLNVMPINKNQKDLLGKYKNTIKDIEKMLKILDEIPKQSYPESFLKIRNSIVEDIEKKIC